MHIPPLPTRLAVAKYMSCLSPLLLQYSFPCAVFSYSNTAFHRDTLNISHAHTLLAKMVVRVGYNGFSIQIFGVCIFNAGYYATHAALLACLDGVPCYGEDGALM
jgi:hypothetical protein